MFGVKRLTITTGMLLLALAPAASYAQLTDDDCLACHEDETLTRADGSSVAVSAEKLAASIHGQAGLSCTDCHADLADTEEIPHPEKLAPVACGDCHDEPAEEYARGAHGKARAAHKGGGLAATCVDCHGSHDILPSDDPASRTYHLNVAATCARCHGNPETIKNAPIPGGNVPAAFADSIHGRALNQAGLLVAPTCVTCHGAHAVHGSEDPDSKVARKNIPSTCGSCHAGVEKLYAAGVHGQALAAGNTGAAVCTDCHTAHHIDRPGLAGWRLDVVKECGTCHEESERTYRDTFHGQVTALGFERVATCADCHGAHDILPKSDPASRISDANRAATCSQCHPGASKNFARYDPHADPGDPKRSATLNYAARFMHLLLAGVFSFFGLHTALWLPRSWRERRRRGKK